MSGQDTCPRTSCNKNVTDQRVQYISLVSSKNKKFIGLNETRRLNVAGSQDEQKQQCAKACMNDGIDKCLSVNMDFSTKLCFLYNSDVYYHWNDVSGTIHQNANSDWVTFHVKV